MTDLIDTIDAAAAKLLEMAGFGATVAPIDGAPIPPAPTLPEQVKAFEVVVKWAETRNELRPPEKGRSKFDGIREQFGQANKRGRRRSAPESGSESIAVGDGPAEPAAGDGAPLVEPAIEPVAEPVAADLFDA